MEIHGSTQYVNPNTQTSPYLQLEVISQWDWKTKPIAMTTIGDTRIYYALYEYSPAGDGRATRTLITNPSEEIKQTLVEMGLCVSNPNPN